jgi:hypothetical protein
MFSINKVKALVFIFTFLISYKSFGQKEVNAKKLFITAGPSLLTVPNTNLGLQTGFQYNLIKWSVLSEVAFPLYIKDKETHSRFIRLSGEIKRYLFEKSFYKFYISIQGHITANNFHSIYSDYFFDSQHPSTVFHYDQTDKYSHVKAVALKTGHEFMVGRKFSFDLFSGIGVRKISRELKNIINLTSSNFTSGTQTIYYHYRRPVTLNKPETKLHLTFGLRIGYRLH